MKVAEFYAVLRVKDQRWMVKGPPGTMFWTEELVKDCLYNQPSAAIFAADESDYSARVITLSTTMQNHSKSVTNKAGKKKKTLSVEDRLSKLESDAEDLGQDVTESERKIKKLIGCVQDLNDTHYKNF